jgi:protein Mpv17
MRYLDSHPIPVKAFTSAMLVATGDLIAQIFFEDGKFNVFRSCRMLILGGVVIGPSLHFWYNALHKFLPAQTTAGALMRLAADQLVFAPTFIPFVFGVILSMEGKIY